MSSITSDRSNSEHSQSSVVSSARKPKVDWFMCPRCFSTYDCIRRQGAARSKVPLVLPCKHVLCEVCIIKFGNKVVCPMCNMISAVVRNEDGEIVFPPHYSIIGYLLWNKGSYTGNPNFALVPSHTVKKKNKFVEQIKNSNAHSVQFATVPVPPENMELLFGQCSTHNGHCLNIRCVDCQTDICCYCYIEDHVQHNVLHLYKMDTVDTVNLQKLKIKVQTVLKHLHVTQQSLQSTKSNPLTNTQSEINECFGNLHGQLYWIEHTIRSQILNGDFPNNTGLTQIHHNINASISRIQHLLKVYEKLDEKSVKISEFKTHMEEAVLTPCILKDSIDKIMHVKFSSKLTENFLDDKFCFESTNDNISLVPFKDFDNVEITNKLDSLSLTNGGSDKETSVQTVREKLINTRKKATKSNQQLNKAKSKLLDYQQVILTHVNGLHSFFVQPVDRQKELEEMNDLINDGLHLSDDFVVGEIYAAEYKTKDFCQWRRGKLLQIITAAENDDTEGAFIVYLVDYGNTCQVKKDMLKRIKHAKLKLHPFAIECQLDKYETILPSTKLHVKLSQIASNKELYIKHLYELHNGVKVVDLTVLKSDGNYQSVYELLCEEVTPTASTSSAASVDEQDLSPSKFAFIENHFSFFENSHAFVPGETESITVTNVIDPHNIYIQLVTNERILCNMLAELNAFYSKASHLSCIPVEKSDVIVRYKLEKCGVWHRGRVLNAGDKNQVGVFLVDYGLSVTVASRNIRVLTEAFTRIECQAIRVSLADVDPIDKSNTWTDSVITFLKRQLTGRNFRYKISVYSIEPLEVVLYTTDSINKICINALLVEMGLTKSRAGDMFHCTHWMQDAPQPLETNSLAIERLKKAEKALVDEKDEFKKLPARKVQVVHYEGPNLIYVKFTSTMDDSKARWYNELQVFCGEEGKTKNEWKIHEYCVVFNKRQRQYKRAIVKKILTGNQLVVFLYDDIKVATVTTNNVFIYDAYFEKTCSQAVFKCYLAGVRPTGDSGKWSSISMELINCIFSMHSDIYVQRASIAIGKDRAIPVNMFYCLRSTNEALQPSTVNYISINKVLMECGLAFAAPVVHGHDSTIDEETCVPVEESSALSNDEVFGNASHDVTVTEEMPINVSTESAVRIEKLPLPRSEWLPAVPLHEREFNAFVTCCESNGTIILRTHEMNDIYMKMERTMKLKFATLDFNQPSVENDDSWQVNSMCTMKLDDVYYRGKVLEVLDERNLQVLMIDFGSDHKMAKSAVRHEVMFPEVCTTVNAVQLYDVHPVNGVWNAQAYQALWASLCDDVKVVVVVENPDLDHTSPQVELYTMGGESINEYIAHTYSSIMYRTCTDVLAPSTLAAPTFKTCSLPVLDANGKVKMCIVSVLKYNKIVVTVKDNSENEAFQRLQSLQETLQTEASNQPILVLIELNEPCICQNPKTNIWNRALIYNVDNEDSGFVMVFYVDHGVLDTVAVETLREIKQEWFDVPVINFMASVNISLVNETMRDYVVAQMNLLCGNEKYIEFVHYKPLLIDVYDENDTVCYHNLLSSGIVRPVEA